MRESHVMLSTFAKVSAIDVGARVVLHSRSGINSRDFSKESRVSSALLPTTTLSLFISLAHCFFVYLDYVSLIHGDPVTTTTASHFLEHSFSKTQNY